MDVFYHCLETIFMCYLTDEDSHGGVPKFASPNLTQFIIQHGAIEPGTQGTTVVDSDNIRRDSTGPLKANAV